MGWTGLEACGRVLVAWGRYLVGGKDLAAGAVDEGDVAKVEDNHLLLDREVVQCGLSPGPAYASCGAVDDCALPLAAVVEVDEGEDAVGVDLGLLYLGGCAGEDRFDAVLYSREGHVQRVREE